MLSICIPFAKCRRLVLVSSLLTIAAAIALVLGGRVAASGAFTLSNVANGAYTVMASMAGYLTAVRSGVVVSTGATTLPAVTLLGGDSDIADLVLLGANFG